METDRFKRDFSVMVGIVVAAGLLVYGGYRYWELGERNRSLRARVDGLELNIQITSKNLLLTKKENSDLAEALVNAKNKNDFFEDQLKILSGAVGEISGTVGVLQKLRQTDPELLKKYSKVYFLSENYVPSTLTIIDTQYLYDKNKPQQIHTKALPFFERLFGAAGQESINLQVVSVYRSFGTQATVKEGYKVTYGAGTANQFSAEQGYSEHQLGTAIDFTSPEAKDILFGFEKTKAYKWLGENAYKFGFALSYPSSNVSYQFEPWHWRFVGVALATKLHGEGKYFYELSQREIDGYLVNIFD